MVAASATVGRPLRRELFRLLQGGEEFGDLTVLRPAEDAAPPPTSIDKVKQEEKRAEGKDEKGVKSTTGKESIEDLESYLEKALGSGSGMGSSFGNDNNDDDNQEQDGDDAKQSQSKRSSPGGGGGQSGSTRKIGIPSGIRHLAILTRDDSNVLNSKVP